MNVTLKRALLAAAVLTLPAAPALAQEDLKERAAEIAEQANEVQAQAGALANDAVNAQERNERGAREAAGARDDDREGNAAEGARAARDDDRDGFDWGLLGLLGLAGLLGLKRRDTVHTDVRHDTRP